MNIKLLAIRLEQAPGNINVNKWTWHKMHSIEMHKFTELLHNHSPYFYIYTSDRYSWQVNQDQMMNGRLFSLFSFREVRDVVFIVEDIRVGNRGSMESSRKSCFEYCSRVSVCVPRRAKWFRVGAFRWRLIIGESTRPRIRIDLSHWLTCSGRDDCCGKRRHNQRCCIDCGCFRTSRRTIIERPDVQMTI